ncbi:hypothetical protein CNR22_22170 [Sphingobacteriaceae bacterium]|nr:hypothetical protein CNR22_22170 [Sphingobacteriaceae bacterium]
MYLNLIEVYLFFYLSCIIFLNKLIPGSFNRKKVGVYFYLDIFIMTFLVIHTKHLTMKKNYLKILLAALTISTSGEVVNAQCTTPTPPSVSGTTLASCTNSAVFTLTGTTTGTNVIGWYPNSFGGNALSTSTVFTTPTLTQTKTYYVGQSASSTKIDTLAMPQYSETVASNETRGYFFTAPNDFIITGLRAPLAINSSTLSALAVVKFSAPVPLYASTSNSFVTLFYNPAATGTNVIPVNIPVYAGDIIGVLGARGGYSCYGPYVLPVQSTLGIPTNTLNLYRLGTFKDLSVDAPADFWTETSNRTIGLVELYAKQGCNSTLTPVTVSLAPVPTITVTPPPNICAGSPYTLTANGASTYTWSGGPQTSTYVVTPSSNTTYSVMGTVLGTCNSTLSSVTISVQTAVPSLSVTATTTVVCSGDPITLTGSGATTLTWSAVSGTVINGSPFTPASSQVYTLSSANSCGIGTKTVSILVNPTPTLLTASSPTSVCEGQTATLTASGAVTYVWSNATAPGATFVVTPTQSGSYNVTGVSAAGCPASGAQALVVYPNPTVNAASNKTIVCSAGPATLSTNGADTYSWSTGSISNITVVNPAVSTVYTVTGTYTATGCSSTKTVNVAVFLPNLQVSNSATVCNGSAITLTANAGAGSTYSWSNGGSFASNNITATIAAIYTVTAKTSTPGASNCTTTATVELGIYPNPTITIAATRTAICKGEKLVLTANGGSTYTWPSLGAATRTVQVGPTIINSVNVYTASGTDANGCAATATFAVKVNACTGITELVNDKTLVNVYPNPNNGSFVIEVKSQMQLTLVNQLGQVIRELSFNQENNYKQNIKDLSNGIYFIKGLNGGSTIQNKIVVNN